MTISIFLLLLSSSFARWCEITDPVSTRQQMQSMIQIVSHATCPKCPHQEIIEEEVISKTFGRSDAGNVTLQIMSQLYKEISQVDRNIPKCLPPCKESHKSVPILKVAPKETHPRVKCESTYVKTHTFKKQFYANNDNCKNSLDSQAGEWIEDILVNPSIPKIFGGGGSIEGENLLKQCPDNCSYYSTQAYEYKINTELCSLEVTLEVDCGNPKLKTEFIGRGIIRDHLNCTR